MLDQISQYINSFLTPYLCCYRIGFSTQQALLSLIEKWKIVLDSKGYSGALPMDLSKNGSINGLSFSSWLELILGVSQNSVLGPILFNVYISALFYLTELTDFCNCADDTTFHPCDSNLDDVIGRLEHNSMLAIK